MEPKISLARPERQAQGPCAIIHFAYKGSTDSKVGVPLVTGINLKLQPCLQGQPTASVSAAPKSSAAKLNGWRSNSADQGNEVPSTHLRTSKRAPRSRGESRCAARDTFLLTRPRPARIEFLSCRCACFVPSASNSSEARGFDGGLRTPTLPRPNRRCLIEVTHIFLQRQRHAAVLPLYHKANSGNAWRRRRKASAAT